MSLVAEGGDCAVCRISPVLPLQVVEGEEGGGVPCCVSVSLFSEVVVSFNGSDPRRKVMKTLLDARG